MMKNYFKKLLILATIISSSTIIAQTVSTFAGSGIAGSADGTGIAAQFKEPYGLAIDAAWNVYVADDKNNKIRKITSTGVVSTIAGSGVAGFANGNGVAAQFNNPKDLKIDANGNIFVADYDNNCIRKITPTGDVTTFAGAVNYGNIDGNATTARFRLPYGLAFDSTGNLFVADNGNHKIRKITTDGTVTTFAGTGSSGDENGDAASAQFNYPNSLVFDAAGNLFVCDGSNIKIKKITPAGTVSTFVGSGNFTYLDGNGTMASLKVPQSLTIQTTTGDLYFSDSSRIRKITPSGDVTTFAGQDLNEATDGPLNVATFNTNAGLVFDSNNNLFVSDGGNNKIRKISLTLANSNFNLNNKLKIYPNPTSGLLNVDLIDLKITKISLFDLNGRILLTQNIENTNSQINIADLAKGIYILKVETNSGVVNKQIIKE